MPPSSIRRATNASPYASSSGGTLALRFFRRSRAWPGGAITREVASAGGRACGGLALRGGRRWDPWGKRLFPPRLATPLRDPATVDRQRLARDEPGTVGGEP